MAWQDKTERRFMRGSRGILSLSGIADPSEISNIYSWFRADLNVTGSSPVTAWDDQIAAQSNDLAANGSPTLNTSGSFDYIEFPDTGGDCLFNDAAANWSGNIQHIFMVMDLDSVVSGDVLLGVNSLRPGGTGVFTRGFRVNVSSISITDGTTSIDASVTPAGGTWAWFEGYFDAANSSIIVNDNTADTGTLADEVLDKIIVPARTSSGFSSANCNVAEIIICQGAVDSGELDSLREYIRDRYNIATTGYPAT